MAGKKKKGKKKKSGKKKKRSSLKNPACNPKRYERYKYLGKRVRDVGDCGLDSPSEFYGILRAIMKDYREGVISERTARGRLLLLYRLTYPEHNSKVRHISKSERERIREAIERAMKRL